MRAVNCKGFNPRAREGRDLAKILAEGLPVIVSIHAPARGATRCPTFCGRALWVSIHAPARGATPPTQNAGRRAEGFNPRAREGRDVPPVPWRRGAWIVSIHAPARGAT